MTERSPDAALGFCERMGLLWEQDGLPRIAGRILGYLLVQPEPCSLDDLASGLGVSKASVSTDTRLLERLGFVQRVGRPADRRDYYQIADDMGARVLELKLESLARLGAALGELRGRDEMAPTVHARLDRLEQFTNRTVHVARGLVAELRGHATPTPPPAAPLP